jgi:hypothetical protein
MGDSLRTAQVADLRDTMRTRALAIPRYSCLGRLTTIGGAQPRAGDEERRGLVRWLRPEHQTPRAKAAAPVQEEMAVYAAAALPATGAGAWGLRRCRTSSRR